MQVPSLNPLPAPGRPTPAAFVSREAAGSAPVDGFAPGAEQKAPAAEQKAPAAEQKEPEPLKPVEFRTYVPCQGGFQEVRQFSVAGNDLDRPLLTRAPDGRASFLFVNEEGLHSVATGGEVNFVMPLEGKLRGLKVHPADGRIFAMVGDRIKVLDPAGKVLQEQPAPPDAQSFLMANDGGVYVGTRNALQRLDGGPVLPLEGAAGQVAHLPSGHTVVTEWQQGIVRVFDSEGKQTMATRARAAHVSLSPEGRLLYESGEQYHTYDVQSGYHVSFAHKGYVRNLFPLRDGRMVAHVESDLTRADLLVLQPDGSEDRRFTIKGGCLLDLQEAPDGKSLMGTINRWHRKPSSTDLVRFDLEKDGLGTTLGELLSNEHGQTLVHTVPEREGLVAGFLPDGGVVTVDKRGARVNGELVGDHAALEARLGKGARLHTGQNLLDPPSQDLDATFRRQIPIRQDAELGKFYRDQGAVPRGGACEFPGPRLDRLPGPDWASQGKAAIMKSLLGMSDDHALKDGVVPFSGPGGAVLKTSAHELAVELPTGDGKFRSLSFVCDWEDFGGGTHWEESWTHALPVQVGQRHYLCAANDKKQVFFIELDTAQNQLKHVTMEAPVRSMGISGGQLVVTAEDGSAVVINPPCAAGETIYEGEPPTLEKGATRVIESQRRVQIGGISLRKKQT